jgi:DNA-binding NarL/FixJ family response regulator
VNEYGRRILIADDKAAARFALKAFLQKEPELGVVDEVADTQELLDQTKATCPDLIFLDWDLPGAAEAGLIPALRQADCQPRIIVLSVRPESASAALGAGADAFVYKGDGPKQLLTVIRSVLMEGTGRMSARPRDA